MARSYSFSSGIKWLLVSACSVLVLIGCGGDDEHSPAQSVLTVDCSGVNCGAVDARTYSGQGVGVWYYINESSKEAVIPIELTGVKGKTLTLVYANQEDEAVLMPKVDIIDDHFIRQKTLSGSIATGADEVYRVTKHVQDFDAGPYLKARKRAVAQKRLATVAKQTPVGQRKMWYTTDYANNPDNKLEKYATLHQKVTAYDGQVVNIWVEDTHYGDGKFDDTFIQKYAEMFATKENSIYRTVTELVGKPWGPHEYDDMIASVGQELDIVFVSDMGNILGYVSPANNFLRDPDDEDLKYSNESLSLYMNVQQAYDPLPQLNPNIQFSTMAHEFMHLVNFYQRAVLMGEEYEFDVFLEESLAEMMEDLVADKIGLTDYNDVRDLRFRMWLRAPYFNCSITNVQKGIGCDVYSVGSSFGAYLLRHYGVQFYRDLLKDNSSTDSLEVLRHAIETHSEFDLETSLRRFGTMIALLPADGSPQWFGLPERIDQGFKLSAIDGEKYKDVLNLPTELPEYLAGFGFFPLKRQPTGDTFKETIPVPPHTALTIVVK